MILLQNYILGNTYSIVCHIPLMEGRIYKKNIHEKTEASSDRLRVTPTDLGGGFFCLVFFSPLFFFLNLGKTSYYISHPAICKITFIK